MIKIKKNIKQFRELFNIAAKYNSEVNLEFKQNELRIFIIDYAGISMVEIIFKKDFFDEYNIDEIINCNIDSEIANKVIKKVGKKEIELIPSEDNFIFKNDNDNFEMVLFHKSLNDKSTPEFESPQEFIIDSNEFFTSINDYMQFDTVCKFGVEDNKFKLTTKNLKVKGITLLESNKIKSNDDKSSFYDGTYISMIADIKNIFKDINIYFGSECPCKINQSNDELKFTWVLAPRVSEE